MSDLADELERDYPAADVTSVVFSRDFAGVGCCVIPQDRVLAIIAALRATPPSAPMTADIAQIISQGYASGKTAAEIAEEVAREFDRSDEDDSMPLDAVHPANFRKASMMAEITSLREKLATAEATYLQFCKKHDEREEIMKKALQFIADGYDNQDINHVDFRVKAYQVALDALEKSK